MLEEGYVREAEGVDREADQVQEFRKDLGMKWMLSLIEP